MANADVEHVSTHMPCSLLLSEHYPPARGGMAQSCDRIVFGMRREGANIDVLHVTRRLRGLHDEAKLGGRYIGFPLGDDPAHGLNLLWNYLESRHPERKYGSIIAFGGTIPLLAGPVISRWMNLPLISLFRGNDFDTALFSPKRSEIVQRAIEASAAIAVVTREKKEKIERLYPGARVAWITNGLDLEEWRIERVDLERGLAWRQANVAGDRRVIGVIGQIKRKKGVLFLLESLLRTALVDRFHFLFVGDVDEEAATFLEANRERLHYSHVPFIDRFNLLPWYAASDMIAIPSFYDGTPNVLVEGTALGIPMLASRAGGMGDHLVDGVHGITFAPGDPHECRHALHRAAIATDEDLRRFAAACRTLASESFDSRLEARHYLNLISECESAPAPSPEIDRPQRPPEHSKSIPS